MVPAAMSKDLDFELKALTRDYSLARKDTWTAELVIRLMAKNKRDSYRKAEQCAVDVRAWMDLVRQKTTAGDDERCRLFFATHKAWEKVASWVAVWKGKPHLYRTDDELYKDLQYNLLPIVFSVDGDQYAVYVISDRQRWLDRN